MNWIVIGLILLAIIGSMMWMMPSPLQRLQALLRQRAMRAGLQVQIVRILMPRALGEAVADERDCVAYRLPRIGKKSVSALIPWQIFKLKSHANTGLSEEWSWSKGEGQLDSSTLQLIADLLQQLPRGVYGLESTPVSLSVYWEEQGVVENVELIKTQLERLLTAGV